VTTRLVHVASGREWRGGQRQVWLLARELAKAGVTEQVVVTAAGSELARRLTSSGIRVREVPWLAGVAPRAFPPVLAEILHRPAIVHAHDPHALTVAGICAALARQPLVVTRRVVFRPASGGGPTASWPSRKRWPTSSPETGSIPPE
jgi:L-malate glycosyltransferase